MRTEKQREAARRNGAKSRGPVTPEGKAKSSANSYRHGLRSENGSPENNTLLLELAAVLIPRPPCFGNLEASLEAEMNWILRQQMALVAFEVQVQNDEIARQRLLHPDASPDLLLHFAFGRLTRDTRAIQMSNRFSQMLTLKLDRIQQRLVKLWNSPLWNSWKTESNEPGKVVELKNETFPNEPGKLIEFKNETPPSEPGAVQFYKQHTAPNEPETRPHHGPHEIKTTSAVGFV